MMQEKDYKTCKLCGVYLDLVPIWQRIFSHKSRSGKPVYKNIVVGQREAFYKSSEEDPSMDEDCLRESKLNKIKRIIYE